MKKCGCLFDYVSNHNIKETKNMAKYTNQNYKELANIIATESENIQDYVEGKKLNKRLKDTTGFVRELN